MSIRWSPRRTCLPLPQPWSWALPEPRSVQQWCKWWRDRVGIASRPARGEGSLWCSATEPKNTWKYTRKTNCGGTIRILRLVLTSSAENGKIQTWSSSLRICITDDVSVNFLAYPLHQQHGYIYYHTPKGRDIFLHGLGWIRCRHGLCSSWPGRWGKCLSRSKTFTQRVKWTSAPKGVFKTFLPYYRQTGQTSKHPTDRHEGS